MHHRMLEMHLLTTVLLLCATPIYGQGRELSRISTEARWDLLANPIDWSRAAMWTNPAAPVRAPYLHQDSMTAASEVRYLLVGSTIGAVAGGLLLSSIRSEFCRS